MLILRVTFNSGYSGIEVKLGTSKLSGNGQENTVKEFPDALSEENKSKSQQSYTAEELLRKAKLRVGTDVIFIELNDFVIVFLSLAETQGKRNDLWGRQEKGAQHNQGTENGLGGILPQR